MGLCLQPLKRWGKKTLGMGQSRWDHLEFLLLLPSANTLTILWAEVGWWREAECLWLRS